MARPTVALDVVADVVCPWCYLGETRLSKALELVRDRMDVTVRRRPFQLDPSVPVEGKPYRETLVAKLGGAARVDAGWDRLRELGRQDGIDFRFEKIAIMPNTLDAHRMVMAADLAGCGRQVLEAIFRAHFTDGRDLSRSDELVSIAVSGGLDADLAAAALTDDDLTKAVRASLHELAKLGVSGVPTFIAGGRHGVSGAQSVEVLVSFLDQVASNGLH